MKQTVEPATRTCSVAARDILKLSPDVKDLIPENP